MRAHPLPLSFSPVRIHAPSEGAIRTCPDPLPHQGGNRGAWVSLAWMFGTRRLGHAPTPPTAHLSDDQIHAPRYCGAMIWFMWGRSASLFMTFRFTRRANAPRSALRRRQMADKPGSVLPLPRVMAIHLGRPLPDASSDLPERRPKDRPVRRTGRALLHGLAPGGVCPATTVTDGAVRSYRTLSPLPDRVGRFAFCGTFPGVAPAGRYPAPCLSGARTFLPELGLCPVQSSHLAI